MRRKSFDNMQCLIARSLERVGEWWSMLIMRDALHGMTRFDQFRRSLGVAPNILTDRLSRRRHLRFHSLWRLPPRFPSGSRFPHD